MAMAKTRRWWSRKLTASCPAATMYAVRVCARARVCACVRACRVCARASVCACVCVPCVCVRLRVRACVGLRRPAGCLS